MLPEHTGPSLAHAQDELNLTMGTARTFVTRYESSILTSKNVRKLLASYEEFKNTLDRLQKQFDEKPRLPPSALRAFSHHSDTMTTCFRKSHEALCGMQSTAEEKSVKGQRLRTASITSVCKGLTAELRDAGNHVTAIEGWLSNISDGLAAQICANANSNLEGQGLAIGANDILEAASRSVESIECLSGTAGLSENPVDDFRPTFLIPSIRSYSVLNFDSMDATGAPSTAEGKAKALLLKRGAYARNVTAIVGPARSGKSCILRGLGHDEDVRRRFVDGCYYLEAHMEASCDAILRELCAIVRLSGGKIAARSMEKDMEAALDVARDWFKSKACLFLVEKLWTRNGSGVEYVLRIMGLVAGGAKCALAFTTPDNAISVPSLAINVIPLNDSCQSIHMRGPTFFETSIQGHCEEMNNLQDDLTEVRRDRSVVLLQLRETYRSGSRVRSALIQRLGYLNSNIEDILIRIEQSFLDRCRLEDELDILVTTQCSEQIQFAVSCFLPHIDDHKEEEDNVHLSTEAAKVGTVILQCIERMEEYAQNRRAEIRNSRKMRSTGEGEHDVRRFDLKLDHLMKRVRRFEKCIVVSREELDALEDQAFFAWKQVTVQSFRSFVNDVAPSTVSLSDDSALDVESEYKVQRKLAVKRKAIMEHISRIRSLESCRETAGRNESFALMDKRLSREHSKISLERSHFEVLDDFLMSGKSPVQRMYINHIRQSPRVDSGLLKSVLNREETFGFRDIVLAHKLAMYQMKTYRGFEMLFTSTDALRCFFLESLYGRLVDIPLSEGQNILVSRMLRQARDVGILSMDGATSLGLVLRLKKNVEEKIHIITEAVGELYADFIGRLTVLELQLSSVEAALYRLKKSLKDGKRVAVWTALIKFGLSMIPIAGQVAGAAVELATQGVDVLTDAVLSDTSAELVFNVTELLTTAGGHVVDFSWDNSDACKTSRQKENLAAVKVGRLMLSEAFRDKMQLEYREKFVSTLESAWGTSTDELENDIDLILTSARDEEDFSRFEVNDRDLHERDICFEDDFMIMVKSLRHGTPSSMVNVGSCSTTAKRSWVLPRSEEYPSEADCEDALDAEDNLGANENFRMISVVSGEENRTDCAGEGKIGELGGEDQMNRFALRNFRHSVSESYGDIQTALCHDEAVLVLKGLFPNDELDWLPSYFGEDALLDTDSDGTYWVSEDQFCLAAKRVLRAVKATQEWHYSTLWAKRFIHATPPSTGMANVALVCRLVRDLKNDAPEKRKLYRLVHEYAKDGRVSLAQFSAIVDSLSPSGIRFADL